jgi:hypothetical protein
VVLGASRADYGIRSGARRGFLPPAFPDLARPTGSGLS